VKKTLPNSKVDIKQLEDGKVSVSITSTGQNQTTNNDNTTECQAVCRANCENAGRCQEEILTIKGFLSKNYYTYCVSQCKAPALPPLLFLGF